VNMTRPERPLDRLPTLKLRLALLIAGAVAVTDAVFYLGVKYTNIWPAVIGAASAALALGFVWMLSRGTLEPLRDMARASEAIARGELSTRVQSTSRDEIGRLADSFNGMAEELEATDRVRRDLVANVSHELRTPIAALQAKLENIIDGVERADPETLSVMVAQVERLGRLVAQLLDLSRLESGAVPLDRSTFELAPMLEQAARESRLAAPTTRIAVAVDPPDLVLDADAERLHQVVANLVSNAVRHSPSDSVVTVAAHRENGAVHIEVVDDGPGIPDAEAERVFERFYRADYARSTRDGGAGLGLAIARWIVDLHGGDIRVESHRPHGCRMVVRIPGPVEIHERAAPPAPAAAPPAGRTLSTSERG
jgi:signal transduction histidine kinase